MRCAFLLSAFLLALTVTSASVNAQGCATRRLPDGSFTSECPSQIPPAPTQARPMGPQAAVPLSPPSYGGPVPYGFSAVPPPAQMPPPPTYFGMCVIANLGACQISHVAPIASGLTCHCRTYDNGIAVGLTQ